MDTKSDQIPSWILQHLNKYGNCCCGREIVKKIGRDEIIDVLKQEGYPCILKVIYDRKYVYKRNLKYPKDAYYILEIESNIKSYFL